LRYPAFTSLTITASLILSIFLYVPGNIHAAASNESLEDRVAGILFEETAKGNIKIVILDFSVSTAPGEGILSDKELKDRGTQYSEEFIANLINKIKDAGKRDKISIIDRGRLDDILRERKLSSTDSTELAAIEIGRIAGVDAIIAGRVQLAGKIMTATAKVVRVKDGEILDIVKQDKQEKPSPIVQTPVTILETVEKIDIGSYKALPLNLPSGCTLSVTIDVLRGNPVDVTVISGQELENFKGEKKFKNAAGFMATKMRNYKRSAELGMGDYYLVVRDSSLGIFSARHSEIKIIVQREP
jgi:predicted dinucleotide-utilizing enzyme